MGDGSNRGGQHLSLRHAQNLTILTVDLDELAHAGFNLRYSHSGLFEDGPVTQLGFPYCFLRPLAVGDVLA